MSSNIDVNGSSSLLSLFAPPSNDGEDAKAEWEQKKESSDTRTGAGDLESLFDPPETVESHEIPSTPRAETDLPISESTTALASPIQPADDESVQNNLMNLFRPPEAFSSPAKKVNSNSSPVKTPPSAYSANQGLTDLLARGKTSPPALPNITRRLDLSRQKTEPRANNRMASEKAALLSEEEDWLAEMTPQQSNQGSKHVYSSIPPAPKPFNRMESIIEDSVLPDNPSRLIQFRTFWITFSRAHLTKSTVLGGFIFLLYQIVFCLAMGAIVTAGHRNYLGVITKMAAGGSIFVAPIYIFFLGDEIPAQYPASDLFLAPFLAKLAKIVWEALEADPDYQEEDTLAFLATFSVLTGIGLAGCAILIFLATTFKLANLGSYLPFPVLCGFFSAVGFVVWTLALSVDTGGKSVMQLWRGGTGDIVHALIHHVPSLIAGSIMKIYGPSNPFFGTYVIFATIVLTYTIMFFTSTSLEDARKEGWFWEQKDLMSPHTEGGYLPPAPFGVWFALDHVHWDAVYKGLETAMAMSFLYLLRCSLHATAMKKNVNNLQRPEKVKVASVPLFQSYQHRRRFTEDVDIEAVQNKVECTVVMVPAKTPTMPLQNVLVSYGYAQGLASVLGSFGVTPSVAAMGTMYTLGAEGRAPQYFCLILLLIFYLTDFRLVAYIPKMSFSCLIVLAFIDMVTTWFVQSYYKTKEKMEWLVVPVISVCAFVMGLLNSVFLGIAISTFIFVAAFFRSGVVKYLASGLVIRSTIERSLDAAEWLDQHGDKIQVVVLQNYLFFGNASSMLSYITSMFEDSPDDVDDLEFPVPPLPKYVVLDLTLVTGMDTSTVDVFNDFKTICKNNGAKLFVAGLSSNLRATLALGNFKPETGERSKRSVRFFADLDTAIGKAEDSLLLDEMIAVHGPQDEAVFHMRDIESFRKALDAIDQEHGMDSASNLIGLFEHTTPIEIDAGDSLYEGQGGSVAECERGLFFISSGMMKIERDSSMTGTRKSMHTLKGDNYLMANKHSLGSMQARSGTVGKQAALLKTGLNRRKMESSIRLARVGPGWILGLLEGVGATHIPSRQVAVTRCKLHHLPYHKIEELQEENPRLVLSLYKVLSRLMARRQEITIGQLVTLHSIMTSTSAGKPMSRKNSQNNLANGRY